MNAEELEVLLRRAREDELARVCRSMAAVNRAVDQVQGVRAAEAVGHFLRQGLPGPNPFPLPGEVAAMECGSCGRTWGEHSTADLAGCAPAGLDDDLRAAA